jgi:hypothetical protein
LDATAFYRGPHHVDNRPINANRPHRMTGMSFFDESESATSQIIEH